MRAQGYSMDLYCDNTSCPVHRMQEEYGTMNGQNSFTACVKQARKDGWQIGEKDYCPNCKPDRR